MKLGDIKIGTHYGAHDTPGSRSTYGQAPRQVEALEIVTAETEVWVAGGFTSRHETRNVRKVKVKVLDKRTRVGGYDSIEKAEEGAIIVIEARKLVGEWKDIKPGLLAKIAEEQAIADKQAEIEARLKAVGFKKFGWGEVHVTVRNGGKRVEIEFNDTYAEKLLKMLEGQS